MKRAIPRHRVLFVVFATLLLFAGVSWGVISRPQVRTGRASASVSQPAARLVARPTAPVTEVANAVAATTSAPSQVSNAPAPVAGEAGLRIFRDPETGEIGPPTAENLKALALETSKTPEVDVANLPQVQSTIPGGGWELNSSSIEESMVMTIDKNGKRTIVCGKDPEAVHKAHALQLQSQTAPAATREDR